VTTSVTTEYPATVALDDGFRSFDGKAAAIRSDGNPYSDGIEGVTCVVQVTVTTTTTNGVVTSTQTKDQLLLNLGTRRAINFAPITIDTVTYAPWGYSNYSGSDLDGPVPVAGADIAPFSSGGWGANVFNITDIGVGEWVERQAVFNTPIGAFRFADYTVSLNPSYGSQVLLVHRTGDGEWTVTTDNPDGTGYVNYAGIMLDSPPPGDMAQLDVAGTRKKPATHNAYRMPFSMTISCPDCPITP
jgi:hypothetical protein